MPTQKDLKRLVRARMQKTGESYTSARAHIVSKSSRTKTSCKKTPSRKTARRTPVSEQDYAKLAGMSDSAVEAKTGCTWKRWVGVLDYMKAAEMSHRDIARLVREKFKIDGWWAQTVTVGYERIRGLREVGQRRGGGYDASRSKTFAVPIARLYRAFSDKRTRSRWLPDVDLKIRTSTREKSMRITWEDGTSVNVQFTSKGPAKSQVAIQHRELPSQARRNAMKTYWGERLAVLNDQLAGRRR